MATWCDLPALDPSCQFLSGLSTDHRVIPAAVRATLPMILATVCQRVAASGLDFLRNHDRKPPERKS